MDCGGESLSGRLLLGDVKGELHTVIQWMEYRPSLDC